jgi:hypothetical protein
MLQEWNRGGIEEDWGDRSVFESQLMMYSLVVLLGLL